jgi:glutathione synthase
VSLQPLYNRLYSEIARDVEFLDTVMGGSVSKVDEFQGELWRCWKECREELVQVSRCGDAVGQSGPDVLIRFLFCSLQPLHLGLFRSDYLLHDSGTAAPLELKQVEFNTISSSFGALSQLAGNLHRRVLVTLRLSAEDR